MRRRPASTAYLGKHSRTGKLGSLYANNMNDSGMYVGACQQQCNVTINQSWFQYNALGYSGTNSGGLVVIENSEFDHNQDGLDTNSQVNGDAPGPQIGTCPGRARSSVSGTTSCWVFVNNYVHDNNNPNAPSSGGAAGGPVGTGMTVSGGTFDTVMDNRFVNNGAWEALFIPYADSNPPSNGQTCTGIGGHEVQPFGCVLDPKGNAMIGNTFTNNGFLAIRPTPTLVRSRSSPESHSTATGTTRRQRAVPLRISKRRNRSVRGPPASPPRACC